MDELYTSAMSRDTDRMTHEVKVACHDAVLAAALLVTDVSGKKAKRGCPEVLCASITN